MTDTAGTVAPDAPPEPDEEIEVATPDLSALLDLHADGTITVKLDGAPLLLPRPKFGQIQTLIRVQGKVVDALNATQDRAIALSARAVDKSQEVRDEKGRSITDASLEAREQIRAEARKLAEEGDALIADMLGQWWTAVFEQLIDDEDTRPALADWPSWFMDGTLPSIMVEHWRFVPRGPG